MSEVSIGPAVTVCAVVIGTWEQHADFLTGGSSYGGVVGWATAIPSVASTWAPALAVIVILGLAMAPAALRLSDWDLAVLPFALIFLGAFLSPALAPGQRAVVAWLAIPFLGYNFAVARPLTHIYTAVPAWTLLAAVPLANIKYQIPNIKYQRAVLLHYLFMIY